MKITTKKSKDKIAFSIKVAQTHSVTVDHESYLYLKNLTQIYGTFRLALQHLIQTNVEYRTEITKLTNGYVDLQKTMQQKIDALQVKIDSNDTNLWDAHKRLIDASARSQQPQLVYLPQNQQQSPNMIQQTNVFPSGPPTDKPFLPPPPPNSTPRLPAPNKVNKNAKPIIRAMTAKFSKGKTKPSEVCDMQFREPVIQELVVYGQKEVDEEKENVIVVEAEED